MNKKIIMVFLFLAVLISIFSAPFSAFADSNNHIEGKPNQYGVVPYNDKMIIRARDIYSNDYSNPEYIKAQKEAGFANYDGKFDAKKHLGGILCSDIPNSDYSENTKNLAKKACESWQSQKNNVLVYYRYNSNTYYSQFHFIFYTGKKDIKLKYAKTSNSFNFEYNGFFADLTESDYNDFYVVSGEIGQPYYGCATQPKVGACSAEFIDVKIGIGNLSPEQYRYKKPFDNYKFIFGTAYDSYHIPVFSTFDIEYPEDYPEEDKVSSTNEIKKSRDKYHPYYWYDVKDKHMVGNIQPYLDSGNNMDRNLINNIKPAFELYAEDKQTKLFEYTGSNLADSFVYDFEKYGVYYVKTYVVDNFPMVFQPDFYPEIIQPIWTKVLIDGGNYAVMTNPRNPTECKDGLCDLPSYAQNCTARFDDLGSAVICEFTKLNSFVKGKLGFLWFPVDSAGRLINNFSNTKTVSCSVQSGVLNVNACFIQEKTPPLYAFLNMVANGSLLFAFVLFLKNQLSGFVSGTGGE